MMSNNHNLPTGSTTVKCTRKFHFLYVILYMSIYAQHSVYWAESEKQGMVTRKRTQCAIYLDNTSGQPEQFKSFTYLNILNISLAVVSLVTVRDSTKPLRSHYLIWATQKKELKLGMAAPTYNSSYSGGWDRRIANLCPKQHCKTHITKRKL